MSPDLAPKVEEALRAEYRVPFRALVISIGGIAAGLVLFLYVYGHVVTWVRDQVRAERVAIDVRRDEESAAQNRQLNDHEKRMAALERGGFQTNADLQLLAAEVRQMRADVSRLADAAERAERKKVK